MRLFKLSEQNDRIRLCEHLARLFTFRNHMTAKAYTNGVGGWITPDEARELFLDRKPVDSVEQ